MLESRLGKLLIIAYALFTIVIYIASFICGTDTCGLYIALPIMPWAYIFALDFGINFPWAVYPIFILLNTSVAYVLGAGVEWLYHYREDIKEERARAAETTISKLL